MLDSLGQHVAQVELNVKSWASASFGSSKENSTESLLVSNVSCIRQELEQLKQRMVQIDQQHKSLLDAQTSAILNSAEIISQLEEAKQRISEERHHAEMSRQRAERLATFGTILDASLNEIYLFDAFTFRFVHVNCGARDNIGYPLDEILQMTPLDIKPAFTNDSFRQLVEPLLSGELANLKFETEHKRKNGTLYPVEVTLQTGVFGGQPVFVAIILDITERRKLEESLRRSQEESLAANRAKSDFLANMSHEIRTPMTAILGYSELLMDSDLDSELRDNAVLTIHRNGKHLLGIINDILDLSKVESGKLELEILKVNPVEILQDVRNLLSVKASERANDLRLELLGEIPESILSDPTRIKQTVLNLVGNAIKFTKNGTVSIVAECNRLSEQLIIHIKDTGIGISEEGVNRLFQPFSQADSSTTRKFGGTGLGLAISRKIARLLGGDISVQSEEGKGSCFTLTLCTGPLGDVRMASHGQSPTTVRSNADSSNGQVAKLAGRILLVEDSPDNQRLFSFVLQKAGAEVLIANNGKEAVELALNSDPLQPFGIILMDMQMPIMDGYEATAALRKHGYRGQIVALTANAMKGDIDRCLEAGCDAFLPKPIDRSTFLPEVANRMGKPSECESLLTS